MVRRLAALLLPLAALFACAADEPALPPGDKVPLLRVEAGGPTAFTTALAFHPDGKTLYAAGFDKVVRVYVLDPQKGEFVVSNTAFRVPIGPGHQGVLNAMAVSADGTWLAVGGRGTIRGSAGFRERGLFLPAGGLTPTMRLDEGTVFLFNTATRAVRPLRGHRGPVLALAFADGKGGAPVLVSAAREGDDDKYVGGVRAWDAATGREVGALLDLPDPVDQRQGVVIRPGLAAWRTGAGAKDVRAALAWQDGNLRLWDLARAEGQPWLKSAQGTFNNTVLHLADGDRLVCGSLRKTDGHLQAWAPTPDGGAKLDDAEVSFPPRKEGAKTLYTLPAALAPLAATPGGKTDHLAVIVRVLETPGNVERDQLRIVQLGAGGWRELPVQVPLTPSSLPRALATSPRGGQVAVADNETLQIRIYAVRDLLAGGAAPVARRLSSSGAAIAEVGFVTKGAARGLRLREKVAAAGEALILDLAKRELTSERDGWQPDTTAPGDWSIRLEPARAGDPSQAWAVFQGEQRRGRVALRPGHVATAIPVLLPPRPPLNVPLVAVPHDDAGEPRLALFHGLTGDPLRQLTGHVGPVRALSFSADGRLLASAGDDQTVCIWGLLNLEKVVGKRGQLRGVAVQARDGKLTVTRADEGGMAEANRGKLRKGDVIEALVAEGKRTPAAGATEFYEALEAITPGGSAALAVAGRGDVALAVGQQTDERKPLFSLFVTRGANADAREWIGWSPLGPYDSNRRTAERHLGWHVNTGDLAAPTRFALAGEYRKDNFKRDVLRYFVERAHPGEALEAYGKDHPEPPSEPRMTFDLREGDGKARPVVAGAATVGRKEATLLLNVDFPGEDIRSVTWRVGEGPKEPFTADEGRRDWSAELAKLPWKRGANRVRIELLTDGPEGTGGPPGPAHVRELTLIYQPPKPTVRAEGKAGDGAAYRVTGSVEAAPGQEATARLVHLHDGKVVSEKEVGAKVDEALRLLPGENRIRLVARNRDAAADDAAESASLTLEATYQAKQPLVTLRAVVPKGGAEVPLDVEHPDRVVVLAAPVFRILGTVRSEEKLDAVVWSLGAAKKEQPTAAQGGEAELKVTLYQPGQAHKVQLTASAGGKETARYVTVEYRPGLPELTLTAPAERVLLRAGKETLKVPVEGTLAWPTATHACRVEILLNGQPLGPALPVDAGAKSVTLAVELPPGGVLPGANVLAVRLRNDWHTGASVSIPVQYRVPPRVVALKVAARAEEPFADLEATVEAPQGAAVELAVETSRRGEEARRRPVPADAVTRGAERGHLQAWAVALKGVPLGQGENLVRLLASTPEGDATDAPVRSAVYRPAPPAPAQVEVRDPKEGVTTQEAQYALAFGVASKEPLRAVRVLRGQEVIHTVPNVTRLLRNARGLFQVDGNHPVALRRGANTLRVVATNEGGEAESEPVVVTYQYQPVVRLRVDRVESAGAEVAPKGEPVGGELTLAAAPAGRLLLQGRIAWREGDDELIARAGYVQVFVNGAQQLPAPLARVAVGKRETTFRTELVLTRPRDNRVELKLPSPLVHEADSHRALVLDCTKSEAEPSRQVHLLIVDTGVSPSKQVREEVFQSFQLRQGKAADQFALAGFEGESGRLYGPLTNAKGTPRDDRAVPENVRAVLREIKRGVQARARKGTVGDVVMVYYRGGESVSRSGHIFHNPETPGDPDLLRWSGISCDSLAAFFGDTPGTHLMFLDVSRPVGEKPEPAGRDLLVRWPDDPHVAVMRYAWLDEAKARTQDAWLLGDVGDGLGKGRQVQEVSRQVGGKFVLTERAPRESRKYRERLLYDEYLPTSVRGLSVSGVR